jgi:hypothetical protein
MYCVAWVPHSLSVLSDDNATHSQSPFRLDLMTKGRGSLDRGLIYMVTLTYTSRGKVGK